MKLQATITPVSLTVNLIHLYIMKNETHLFILLSATFT